MSIFRRYRFFWSHPGAASGPDPVEFFPQNENIGYVWVREEDQLFYRLRLKEGLDIGGTGRVSDFDYLYAIEIEDNRCVPIQIDIYRRVPGSADVLEFSGNAALDDGDWNLDRCSVRLKTVESIDQYSRLTDKWKKPVNLIELATETVEVYTSVANFPTPLSTIELEITEELYTYGETPAGGPVPDGPGWVRIYNEDFLNVDAGGFFYESTTEWVREVADASFDLLNPPPGDLDPGGWVWAEAYPGDFRYVRSLNSRVENAKTVIVAYTDTQLLSTTTVYSWLPSQLNTFSNGIPLAHALESLLDAAGTGLTVKSNIFGINPSGPSPATTPYDDLTHTKLVVYERSDAKLPSATNPATVLDVSLQSFLECLAKTFQVYPVISGDTLILEHYSFFEGNQGLDLTVAPYATSLLGKRQYSYERSEVPAGEAFYHDAEQYSQFYFRRWEFSYDIPDTQPNCLSKVTDVKETVANLAVNDIQELVANPTNFSDDGLTFIATFEYDGKLVMSVNPQRGVANFWMSPQYLGPRYWMHRRFFYTAIRYIRGTDPEILTFLSWKKFRKQVPITIPLCDPSEFDPLDLVKTNFGWGEVSGSPEYDLKRGTLTVETTHQGYA
jgi:hypothetical protein